MKLTINGRIDSSEFFNGKYMVVVVTPAVDAYSQPSSFKVRAQNQLGNIGEEVALEVEVSGYVQRKTYLNKKTNQSEIFNEANVYFDVLTVKSFKAPLAKAS